MNNFILVLALVLLYGISYALHGKRIGPSNVLVLAFLLPALLVLYFDSYFSHQVSFITIAIISSLLCSFILGEVFSAIFLNMRRSGKEKIVNFRIGKGWYYFFLLISLSNVFVQYDYLMQVGKLFGATNIVAAYASTRLMLIEYQNTGQIEVHMPYYALLLSMLALCIEVVCFHIYVYKRVVDNVNMKRLLPVIFLYFLSLLFSTGRAAYFPVLVHAIYSLFVIFRYRYKPSNLVKKYFAKIVLGCILGGSLFLVLGALRQNTDGDDHVEINTSETIATYVAAPILGLDIYICNGMKRSNYIGEHTFRTYYDLARIFGVPYKRTQFHKADFHVGKGSSNVYTGFYYWISDFGFLGACLYSMILGVLLGYFYNRKPILHNVLEIYFRSFLYFAVLMMFFDDQFNSIFDVFLVLKLLIIYYLQNILQNKNFITNKK